MPDMSDTTATDPRLRALHEKLEQAGRDLRAAAEKREQRKLLDDDTARAVALALAPFLVNVAASGALRRLSRGLAEAGLPVRELERRQARRIVWPAMALLRILGGTLRGPRCHSSAGQRVRDERRDVFARRLFADVDAGR